MFIMKYTTDKKVKGEATETSTPLKTHSSLLTLLLSRTFLTALLGALLSLYLNQSLSLPLFSCLLFASHSFYSLSLSPKISEVCMHY